MDTNKKSTIKKFFSYYKPYKGLFAATLLLAGISTAAGLLFPLLTRYITGEVLEGGMENALSEIWKIGGLMLVLLAIQQGSCYFVDYRGHVMGAKIERDMRRELFDHYQKLPVSFYDSERVGRLMSRLTSDLWSLGELYHHGPEDVILYFIRFVGAFVILLTIDVQLSLWTAALLPIGGVLAVMIGKRMNKAVSCSQQQLSEVNAQAEDTLAGIRVVKTFTGERLEREKFCCQNEQFLKSRGAIYKNEANLTAVLDALTRLMTILIVVLGGVGITGGQMSLPDLLAFLLYASYLTEPVQALLHTIGQYQEGVACFKRFAQILEIAPEPQDAPDALSPKLEGGITFRNVSFRYPDFQSDVLRDISVDIKPGEYVALVGPSGVGKTTFCSLIPRFYETTAGEILVDGIPTEKIRMEALRGQIGMVQQDVYLFAGSVRENIRYGRPDASDEEVAEAAKRANAHDFIMALPNGYDTDVGERGVKLSGGQKQRISIARAFLKNPPILILDEATSALDNESEQQIKEALETLAKSRTTLVIAHRRSTIESAQRTLALQDGRLIEQT
ncbi:MAG: ABC transporter ATP-binding protein [Oscillospiraceae bacterium]|nr:ABC transporter ATP-binding protein [Oscillospiraceae bacterium]